MWELELSRKAYSSHQWFIANPEKANAAAYAVRRR
jgi:hypothetical protein